MNYQDKKERICKEIEELNNYIHKTFLKASLMLTGIISVSGALAIIFDMAPIFLGGVLLILVPYKWFNNKTAYENYEVKRLLKIEEELTEREQRDKKIEELKNKIDNLSLRQRNLIIEMLSNEMEYTDFTKLIDEIVEYKCADFLFKDSEENKLANSFVSYNFKFDGNKKEEDTDLETLNIDLGNCEARKIKKKTNDSLIKYGKEF